MREADLQEARLRDTRLHAADLRDANLRGADLEGADWMPPTFGVPSWMAQPSGCDVLAADGLAGRLRSARGRSHPDTHRAHD